MFSLSDLTRYHSAVDTAFQPSAIQRALIRLSWAARDRGLVRLGRFLHR